MSTPIILNIETSTNVCSIAISEGPNCLFKASDTDGMNHAALLSVFIAQGMDLLKTLDKKLDAVAVSSGPGSYTGLRIGVSTAKGLCFGFDIPLISISTLEVLTAQALMTDGIDRTALFCPMIDARRMEVYAALYNTEGEIQREIAPDIIDETSYSDFLEKQTVYFFGNGADKCKTTLSHPSAKFIDHLIPLAENMIHFSISHYEQKQFVDLAYFEPFYLKEFQTTSPKQNS
jgi:tRNA threonylcarbamoyladenosine biosynthesis protein TsaB